MKHTKLFEEFLNESKLPIMELIGQKVDTSLLSNGDNSFKEVTVTKNTIDSVCDYLQSNGVMDFSIENFKLIMANLELSYEETEKLVKGEKFEVELSDAESDILYDMTNEE